MEEYVELYETGWSEWGPFPNPEKGEYLYAPFGAGVYQLRNKKEQKYVLFGTGSHLAYRMSSLLPEPYGQGTRKNTGKRNYVLKNIDDIEYRTIAFASKEMAKSFENFVKIKESYIFNT